MSIGEPFSGMAKWLAQLPASKVGPQYNSSLSTVVQVIVHLESHINKPKKQGIKKKVLRILRATVPD